MLRGKEARAVGRVVHALRVILRSAAVLGANREGPALVFWIWLAGPFTGRVADCERRSFARVGPEVIGLVALLALALSAACGEAAERSGAPSATRSDSAATRGVATDRGEAVPEATRAAAVATRDLADARAAADYRALVCEALHILFGRADARGFALAYQRTKYLWDGGLSASAQRTLAPHRDYLFATLETVAAVIDGRDATARWEGLDSALDRADPRFAAVCKATGVPP